MAAASKPPTVGGWGVVVVDNNTTGEPGELFIFGKTHTDI